MRPYVVFFAFPFDPATFRMYSLITKAIAKRSQFKNRLVIQYGFDGVIADSPFEPEIDSFKAQNADLITQFRTKILESDIVVADMTNDNPNVHVELGIAILANKNILRVTGRGLERIASDVKGTITNGYRDKSGLQKTIERYLTSFLKIKDLPLSVDSGKYYTSDQTRRELQSRSFASQLTSEVQAKAPPVKFDWYLPLSIRGRDFELKVRFKFQWVGASDDWFGIFFRYLQPMPWNDGYLLHLRKSGVLDLIAIPYPPPDQQFHTEFKPITVGKEITLHMRIDGDCLDVSLADDFNASVRFRGLRNQSFGQIALGCFRSDVMVTSFEFVNRDTIAFG